ncbi:MAG: agmatine deiminase family protein [Planctomycetota bacterium]
MIACTGSAQLADDAYPEAAAIPKGLTDAETAVLAASPLTAARSAGMPTGDVRSVAEYEPMEGILIAYEGPSSWRAVLRDMGRHITTTGDANLYVMCDSTNEAATAQAEFVAAGADPSRVITKVRRTDTIWMRDYGPRYIYENGIRAIVDHTYNRPRPNDNLLPSFWGADRGEEVYTIPLVHGGGNYHLDALGGGASTSLIEDENPGLTGSQIIDLWRDFQGVETTLFDALPAFVDSTQHIDMWMQVAADDVIVISDWPLEPTSSWDATCDAAAADFAAAGWTVIRTPAIRQGGTHYTFTNVVMCNDIVLVPEYDNISATYSQQAFAAWQSAVPSKTIIQVDCDAIVTASGVMHCIVMHVPENSAGADPVAWLIEPAGGVYDPGETADITWRTDDDNEVVDVDLLFQARPSEAFQPIAENIADTGLFAWTVPDVNTQSGVVRVVARDAEGRQGIDDVDALISITGSSCLVDVNGDGFVDPADFNAWVIAFNTNGAGCDQNDDGVCTAADFNAWVLNYNAGC